MNNLKIRSNYKIKINIKNGKFVKILKKIPVIDKVLSTQKCNYKTV